MCILHAFGDQEVGWESSVKLLESLEGKDVDLILRKTGNHRLMKSGGIKITRKIGLKKFFTMNNFLSKTLHS